MCFFLQEKCAQYWPSPSTVMQCIYGDITVDFISEEKRDGYTVITLNISNNKVRDSTQLFVFNVYRILLLNRAQGKWNFC